MSEVTADAARRVDAAPALRPVLSWQPALERAQAYLERAGIGAEEASRLSRRIVVSCAEELQPASSEEAARLALEEAQTVALGLGRSGPAAPAVRELSGSGARSTAEMR